MSKTRIMIVDDSVVVRRLTAEALAGDPDLEVVGTAANGRIALAKLSQLNPDLVLLDMEMPEMDGLATLAALRQTHPQLPVIMVSRFTQMGAVVTLEALSLGANDYVPLPETTRNSTEAQELLRQLLVPRIKQYATPMETTSRSSATFRSRPSSVVRQGPKRVEIVAIGSSTGGPNALVEVLSVLPADFPVPVVIVQHMPPLFTRLLADRLAARTALTVREAKNGPLTAAQVWLAPGDFHLVVERDIPDNSFRLHQGPTENSCRPSVDVLFRSVADVYGGSALAVVLTGMGQDGLRGCERVREVGGQILVQDEASSVVWGMPGFVARAGLAEGILPLPELGGEILRRVRQGRTLSASG